MAQVSREVKRVLLQLLPERMRLGLLQKHPNLRKAAPHNLRLQFDQYLDEFRVNIDTRFKVERIMWTGQYEPDLLGLLAQWVRPESVCFDVGANVGALSLAMAQRIKGGSGRVYSFEPAPETFARLKANIALNPSVQAQMFPVNLGVSSEPGTLHWSEEAGNEGNGGLLGKGGVEVPVTTIDKFCAESGVSRMDVMKIDVESMEYEVLCGACDSLRRFQPKLYFETMGRSQGLREPDIFNRIEDLLKSLGYDLFRLDARRELVPTDARHFVDYTIGIPRKRS